jgi:hypothetical protein
MTTNLEIYFRDLAPNAQVRLLSEFQAAAEKEILDVYPIAEIEGQMKDNPKW